MKASNFHQDHVERILHRSLWNGKHERSTKY